VKHFKKSRIENKPQGGKKVSHWKIQGRIKALQRNII
jgi:hypothetical protein